MFKIAVAFIMALVSCFACQSLAAQSRISSEHNVHTEKIDPDNVIRRHQWFRRGRQGVQSKSAAALRLDAYRQMVMRRNASNISRSSSAQIATLTTPQVWTSLGPSPILSNISGSASANFDYGPVIGRVTSLFVDPSDATGNTVYLGGATGGLWKSTNGASAVPNSVTWSPLLGGQPTLSVGAMGIQPGNSNVIILGTGEPDFSIDSYYALGFLRSADNGSTWTLINSAASGAGPGNFPMDLRGIAFSSVVFSTDNPNLVVAGAGASGVGFENGVETITDERFGIFYSTDAGQTWTRATFLDGSTLVKPWSVSSIVYNSSRHLFYAIVGFQGIYSSSDGATWSRIANQPGPGLILANCPAFFSTTCPLFRGVVTKRPGADEMYVWYVDLNSKDQGVYKTTDGGQTWTALNESGITNCGDAQGCGTEQGFFNLTLSAVPQSNGGTDLYAGAVNIFKCSINTSNPTCNASPFLNLTHVYGCSPIGSLAHVHPDQHAIAFALGNPQIIYFGNDGGVYRTLDGARLSSGTCGQTTNAFDNLNGTMGSMAQFVWLSQDPNNQSILLGGTQDNGSPALTSAGVTWPEVNLGDGGYNAINPASPSEWFTAHTDVSIQRCTLGASCTPTNFSSVVTNSTVGGDVGPFYTPYMLDPQASGKMLVATCRIWRGPSSGGTGWTALSNNFDTANGSACSADAQNQIRAIAAGGTLTSSGSQVIWAGSENGTIWTTSNANGGPSTWHSPFNTLPPTPISAIAIDPKDPTGNTVFFTTLGFFGDQITVISPNVITGSPTGDLPNIPATSIIFDPEFPNIMYVGTDIAVFQSLNGGTNWVEIGSGSLPSAPVLHLEVFHTSGVKKLRASTYGRGVWETDLPTGSIPLVSFSNYSVTFPAQAIGTTSPSTAVTLTNIGSAILDLTGLNLSGSEFMQSNNCPGTLAAAASCTINITFTPTASGSHAGTLTLTDNANDSPQVVQLVGNIPIPAISLIDSTLPFPGVAVGAVFGPISTLVFSSGTAPLTISNVSATGDFSETDDCVGTQPVGQSCTIRVSFRPSAPGPRQGALLISDNASGSPQSISLTGLGVAELVVATDVLNFGNVLVGQSRMLPITLSNYTAASIGIKQLTLGGGVNPGDFSQTNNCGSSVASQVTCTIDIVFTPSGGINAWTNLTVLDTNGNTVGALVQGFDTDFLLSSNTSPSAMTITAGQTATFTVFVGGQGAFNGTVSLSCKGGPPGSTCSTTPSSALLTFANPLAAITVSVKTSAQVAANPPIQWIIEYRSYRGFQFALAFLIVVLQMSWLIRRRLVTRIAIPRSALLFLLLEALIFATSCGGGGGSSNSSNPSPSPGPTSFTIIVTGTSGSLTNSTNLTLVVNP